MKGKIKYFLLIQNKRKNKNNINIDCSFDMKIIDNYPTTIEHINIITNLNFNSEDFCILFDYC